MLVRKTVGILAVHGLAVGIHADARARKLPGAADAAFAADKAGDHVVLAIENGERRALVDFRAHTLFELNQTVEAEIFVVVGFFLAPRQRSGDAAALDGRDFRRHFEQKHVATLAELRDQNLVAGLGAFQRMRQHQKRVCGACIADIGRKIVAHLRRIDAGLFG